MLVNNDKPIVYLFTVINHNFKHFEYDNLVCGLLFCEITLMKHIGEKPYIQLQNNNFKYV